VSIDVYLEVAPKKVFACAVEWPGWARSGTTEEAALEALARYAARYRPVTELAGVRFPASAAGTLTVVERVKGSTSTAFGIPDSKDVAADARPLTKASAGRLADLVEAAWAVFDDVVAGAPASLRKGPRGGGRDRDAIVRHVHDAEPAYAAKMGLPTGERDRATIIRALRAARAPVPEPAPTARSAPWPYRYAARRIAWHALDHAWEIEDRA
jgi:hypothetical protein